MRLSIFWRIMEIKEGCYPRWITPSEISIILHMIWELNSIIVLLFVQNNSYLKKKGLKHGKLHQSIDVKFIFDSARLGLSNSVNILQMADVAMFLAMFSPSSYSWNEWNVRHFLSSQSKQLNLVPRSSRLMVPLPVKTLHFWRHFFVKHKILPNLVISNWIWWIKPVLLANQNRENILNE